MSDKDCIFCKIITGTIPADIITQTDDILVIKDIAPKAPLHYLIIPKKHIKNLTDFSDDDASIAGNVLLMARDLSKGLSGSQSFRLIFNNGADSGQSIFHVHAHFLSGKKYTDF